MALRRKCGSNDSAWDSSTFPRSKDEHEYANLRMTPSRELWSDICWHPRHPACDEPEKREELGVIVFEMRLWRPFSLAGLVLVMFLTAGHTKSSSPNPEEALDLARQYIDSEQLERAVTTLKAIETTDRKITAHIDLLLGRIYLGIGKPAKALDFFEHAAYSTMDDAAAFLGMAEARLALGNLTQARAHARSALRSDPDLVRAALVLARADDRSGKVTEARRRLNKLAGERPESEDVAVTRAEFLFQRGNEREAIKGLNRFTRLFPGQPAALDTLGRYLWATGNQSAALQARTDSAKAYIQAGNDFRAEAIIAWIQAHDRSEHYIRQLRTSGAPGDYTPSPGHAPSPSLPPTQLTRPEPLPIPPGASYSQGTGFIVGDGRHIVTNRHVIEGTTHVVVRNGTGQVRHARIISIGKEDDLAVLELKTPFPPESAVPIEAMGDPRPGRAAIVMGFPLAGLLGEEMPSLTEGIVSKTAGFGDDPTMFQLTAKMNKGNSGGPVFDDRGNLIGVAVAKLNVKKIMEKSDFLPEDVNLAIKITRIFPMLGWGQPGSRQVPEGRRMALEDLYQAMLPKVVLIAAVKD